MPSSTGTSSTPVVNSGDGAHARGTDRMGHTVPSERGRGHLSGDGKMHRH